MKPSQPCSACVLEGRQAELCPVLSAEYLLFLQPSSPKVLEVSLRNSVFKRTKGKSLLCCIISSQFCGDDSLVYQQKQGLNISNVYCPWHAIYTPAEGPWRTEMPGKREMRLPKRKAWDPWIICGKRGKDSRGKNQEISIFIVNVQIFFLISTFIF